MKKVVGLFLLILCSMVNAYSGVVVEGSAKGIDPVSTVEYLSAENVFIINENTKLRNPVSSDALLEIIDAINLDERIGVSVTLNDELIVYGKLHKRSETADMLESADNFIRSVVFAEQSRLRNYTLPQNYQPIKVVSREKSSVIFLQLSNFEYSKKGSEYIANNLNAEVMLIPMATYTAPDGGYLPDYDALEKGVFQKEDKANADHMSKYKMEYLRLPPLREAIKVGQASAIVRMLRDSGINMNELSRSIIEGEAITLSGKAGIENVEAAGSYELEADNEVMVENVNSTVGTPEVVNSDSPVMQQEVIAEVSPAVDSDYAESIRQVFLIDKIIGNTDKVKLSRKSVNDGSYISYRKKYLDGITDPENIDLSKTPNEFQAAFNSHIQAWEKVLSWLEGKSIEDGQDSFTAFYEEHGKYRKELKETYNLCKEIAAKYQIEN